MDTALDQKESDSRHVLAARADKELAHAYEQITRADEQISQAQKQLSKLERDAAASDRSLFDRPAIRGLTGLLLAGCIGIAAIAWQSSYRDTAKDFIARLTPQRVAASSPPLENRSWPRFRLRLAYSSPQRSWHLHNRYPRRRASRKTLRRPSPRCRPS